MDKFSYFIAPLRQNTPVNENLNLFNFIDWDEIEKTNNNTHQQSKIDLNNLQYLGDAIIIHPNNSTRYFVNSIHRELNPSSLVPEGMYTKERISQSFSEFYKEKFGLEVKNLEQYLLEVEETPEFINFLEPDAPSMSKERTAIYIVPEFYEKSLIRASVFRSALLLPSIITRLDSHISVLRLKNAKNLPVGNEYLVSALVTPSAEMGINYERLEFLGDSFLDYLVKTMLYISEETQVKELHEEYMKVTCNRSLCENAKDLCLYSVCHNKSSTPIIKMAKFFIADHTKNRNSNLLKINLIFPTLRVLN